MRQTCAQGVCAAEANVRQKSGVYTAETGLCAAETHVCAAAPGICATETDVCAAETNVCAAELILYQRISETRYSRTA